MGYDEPDIERLLKTFRFKKGDRVPNIEFVIDERTSSFILGREAKRTLHMEPKEHIELAQKIGMDAIGFGIYYSPGRIEQKASDGSSYYIGGDIKKWDDLKGIRKPDLKSSFDKLERYLELTKNTRIGVFVYTHGPLDPVYLGMGMADFMIGLHDDIKFIEHLMDFILGIQCEIIERLVSYELSFIHIVDDVALRNGLMIQPGLFKELWIPRMKRLIAPVKEKGIPLTFHSDGNLSEIIPILIELGFCAVHPIEPAGNNIYELKRSYENKMCLIGNIDIAGPLAFGTKEEVITDVRKHIDRLSLGGGYVVSSSSSITNGIPPENFLAMVHAVHEFGRYG